MARYHFTKPHDLAQLHDELLAAVPAMRPLRPRADAPGAAGACEQVVRVESAGEDIWIGVPDEIGREALARVVQDHAPRPRSPEPRRADLLAAVAEAATLGELQAAVLDYLRSQR